MQATAAVVVAGGASEAVSWSSSNTAVATVDASGLVTAVAPGTTTIVATSAADNTKSGSSALTVAVRSVLYYVDASTPVDDALDALDAAVLTLGVEVTSAADDDFVDLLGESPDLVVYFRQLDGDIPTDHADALTDFVAAGGKLAFWHWGYFYSDVRSFAGVLQAGYDLTENAASLTVTLPQYASGLSSTTLALTNPVATWGTYATGLRALAGGTVQVTFDTGSAALVSGNDGRTMMLGFVTGSLPAGDGQQLYTNIFTELLLQP